MIDLHTHVLPGIDDGPADVQGSLEMAEVAADAGITEIVATPHVSWHWETTPDDMEQGVAALQEAFDYATVPIRVRPGAELALTRAVELSDDELDRFRLGGGEWLLIECPLTSAAAGFHAVLEHFVDERGYRIVLAHPERSPIIQRAPQRLYELVEAGMLTQITAGSLAGQFGRTVRDFAMEMVAEGLVHNVASDAHDSIYRAPGLLGALREAERELPGIMEHAEWLCEEVPRAILDGGPIPMPLGPPPRRRRALMHRVLRRR